MTPAVTQVADAFEGFLDAYHAFKEEYDLAPFIPNELEMTTALGGKVGRVQDIVKHVYRKDPKPAWELALQKQLAGVINYAVMLAARFDVDLTAGIQDEFNHAVVDHGGE